MNSTSKQLDKLDLRITSRNLAKQIFAADLPEQYIRTIPAQSLYIALKHNGLAASADLIEIADIEQCRLMIDFDCWHKSYFHEENFWEWLSLSSEDDGLTVLQKLIKCFDLKIITLLMTRYVNFEFFEEATDTPPAPGYYTPDKGMTWIYINIEDSEKHFLFGRLLALLFETDADLFYKLLTLSSTQTSAVLEEEAYQDKIKRLAAEGIPEYEHAEAVNNAADDNQISALLTDTRDSAKIINIQAVEPLIFDSGINSRFNHLLQDISIREALRIELTYIMNSAIVFWGVEFFEYEEMMRLSDKVKGAINIGLEKCEEISNSDLSDIYKKLGLIKIYQYGLLQLKKMRLALKEIKSKLQVESIESSLGVVLDLGSLAFPEMPEFLKKNAADESEPELSTKSTAIESLQSIERILQFCRRK